MIRLHPDARTRLIQTVADAIASLKAKHGMFIDLLSAAAELDKANNVVPSSGEVHDQLTTYIGEYPISTFLMNQLDIELRQLNRFQSDAPSVKLTDIEGYGDPQRVADRLVAQLSSLPWQYSLTIMLPDEVSSLLATDSKRELNEQIRLNRPDENFRQLFPLETGEDATPTPFSGLGLLSPAFWGPALPPSSPRWQSSAAYLQIGAAGFIGPYGGSMPLWNAEHTLRAFCGLGIGLRLFRIEHKYSPTSSPLYFIVHRQLHDQSWQFERTLALSENLSRALNSFELHTLEGRLDTDEKKAAWITWKLDQMRTVFSEGSKAELIVLASQWLFDSYAGSDELLNYVQAMVVLEILLGDKAVSDEIGLGRLLSNRCAYLIGNNYEERADVLRRFGNIYAVRSEIVHRGKHRLNARERKLFYDLHWMCRRVIEREINLLKAGSQ
jgi:hypothetical protein